MATPPDLPEGVLEPVLVVEGADVAHTYGKTGIGLRLDQAMHHSDGLNTDRHSIRGELGEHPSATIAFAFRAAVGSVQIERDARDERADPNGGCGAAPIIDGLEVPRGGVPNGPSGLLSAKPGPTALVRGLLTTDPGRRCEAQGADE